MKLILKRRKKPNPFHLACSPYFKAMFTGELAESRQTEIIIHDIDEFAMELLIEFCYTSRIIVDEKNVQTLLPAACILQVRILLGEGTSPSNENLD